MAINFNSLPSDRPNATAAPGQYYATIEKAEMKTPTTPGKKDYLNLTLNLTDKDGKSAGKIFDILSESDADIIRYKIQRFITALEIPINGAFELKDLVKIVPNKKLIVDITVDDPKKKDPNSPYSPKAVVDVFSGQIYYPIAEAAAIFGTPNTGVDQDAKVDAPDADDAGANQY
jgi:hypothetical protein